MRKGTSPITGFQNFPQQNNEINSQNNQVVQQQQNSLLNSEISQNQQFGQTRCQYNKQIVLQQDISLENQNLSNQISHQNAIVVGQNTQNILSNSQNLDIRQQKNESNNKINMIKNQYARVAYDVAANSSNVNQSANSSIITGKISNFQNQTAPSLIESQNIKQYQDDANIQSSNQSTNFGQEKGIIYQQHLNNQINKSQNKENFDCSNIQNNVLGTLQSHSHQIGALSHHNMGSNLHQRLHNKEQNKTTVVITKQQPSTFQSITSVQINNGINQQQLGGQQQQTQKISSNYSQGQTGNQIIQTQNKVYKNYKQYPSNQTSNSINMPRGTNPKRSFGRENNGRDQKIEPLSQQSITQLAVNKFHIHPILQQNQQQMQNQIINNTASNNNQMMIVENNISQEQQTTSNAPNSDKYKFINYEYNSSSNLHFKTQRNQSLLSGINYPKKNQVKNLNRQTGSAVDETSLQGCIASQVSTNLDSLSQNCGNQINNNLNLNIPAINQKNIITTTSQSFMKQSNYLNDKSSVSGDNSAQIISNQYAPQIIGNTTKNTFRAIVATQASQGSSSVGVSQNSKYQQKNSSVTSKMSGVEKVGQSSNSQGPTIKNTNQNNEQINQNNQIHLMNLKTQNNSSQQQSSSQNLKQINEQMKSTVGSLPQNSNYLANLNQQSLQLLNNEQSLVDQNFNNQTTQITLDNNNLNVMDSQLADLKSATMAIQKIQNRFPNGQRYTNFAANSLQSNQSFQNKIVNQTNQHCLQKNGLQKSVNQALLSSKQNQSIDRSSNNRNAKTALAPQERLKLNVSNQTGQIKAPSDIQKLDQQNQLTKSQEQILNIPSKKYIGNINQQQPLSQTQAVQQIIENQQNVEMIAQQVVINGCKKRNGSQVPSISHLRNKSQNSSSNTSAIIDSQIEKKKKAYLLKEDKEKNGNKNIDKKMEYEIQKALSYEEKLKIVNENFKKRCQDHLNKSIEECDIDNAFNPQFVAEFTKDIMKHYMKTEGINQPKNKYMEDQPEITERMRSILIDWIIEVHFQFKLKTESLFLTINMIDRYLEKKIVTKQNLQLVGVSAMLIACKYEEIWPPLIKDYIHMCDNAYNKEQIIEMEMSMLRSLDFNVDFISSNSFLERFAQITKVDKTTHHLAQYMIEISMLDYTSIYIKPSYLSMSALYLAQKIMKNPNPWNKKLAICTNYSERYVSTLSQVLLKLLRDYQKPSNTHLVGLKKKFSYTQFSHISTYFQFDYNTSQNKDSSNNKSNDRISTGAPYIATTDKKRTISADKLNNQHHTSQKTISSTNDTSCKKGNTFQFNHQKAQLHAQAIDKQSIAIMNKSNHNIARNQNNHISSQISLNQENYSHQYAQAIQQQQSQVPHLPQIVLGGAKQFLNQQQQQQLSSRSNYQIQNNNQNMNSIMQSNKKVLPSHQNNQQLQSQPLQINQNILNSIPAQYQDQIMLFLQHQNIQQQNLLNQMIQQQQQYDQQNVSSNNEGSYQSHQNIQEIQKNIQNYLNQELQEFLNSLNIGIAQQIPLVQSQAENEKQQQQQNQIIQQIENNKQLQQQIIYEENKMVNGKIEQSRSIGSEQYSQQYSQITQPLDENMD